MFVEGKMVRAPRPWHESKELKLMRDDSQEIEIEQDDLETRVSLPERPYSGCKGQSQGPGHSPLLGVVLGGRFQRILTSMRRSILQGTMRCGVSWAIHVLKRVPQ
jgi:hypothetical protein